MNSHSLQQISPHVYWLPPNPDTDRPILGLIAGSRKSLIVDAGNSSNHARLLLDQISPLNVAPPTYLALTHWHWDHVFGASEMNLLTLAHTETGRVVSQMAQLDWSDQALDQRVEAGIEIPFCRDMIKAELPDRRNLTIRPLDITFQCQVELDLDEIQCQIIHVGGDHSPDSSVIYLPQDRIMFIGDCLSPDIYHGEYSYTAGEIYRLMDQILGYDVDFYLEGHNPNPLPREEMLDLARVFKIIGDQVTRLGSDRKAIISSLEERLPGPLNEDHLEIMDGFIAGLRKKAA